MLLGRCWKYSATKPPPALVCGNAQQRDKFEGRSCQCQEGGGAGCEGPAEGDGGRASGSTSVEGKFKATPHHRLLALISTVSCTSTIAVWLTPNQNGGLLKAGANNRKAARDDAAAEKERQRLAKLSGKAAAEAEEEAAMSSIKTGKTKKVKKKEDLGALLAEGLAKQPKTKAQKEAEKKKKAKEAARKKQAEDEAAARAKKPDELAPAPLVPNLNHQSFWDEDGGERGNGDVVNATGIEAAMDALTMASSTGAAAGAAGDAHPEKRAKAAYLAFEEANLPLIREELPGLKLSQYKNKLFERWKKHPDNPMNQVR